MSVVAPSRLLLNQKLRKIYGLGMTRGAALVGGEMDLLDLVVGGAREKLSLEQKKENAIKRYNKSKCAKTGKLKLNVYKRGLAKGKKRICKLDKSLKSRKCVKMLKGRCAEYDDKGKSKNPWIKRLKAYQKEHGVTFKQAMEDLKKT